MHSFNLAEALENLDWPIARPVNIIRREPVHILKCGLVNDDGFVWKSCESLALELQISEGLVRKFREKRPATQEEKDRYHVAGDDGRKGNTIHYMYR